MARYKIVDRSPRFLPVILDAQLMSGSFEYALDYLIDHQLDLKCIRSTLSQRRYRQHRLRPPCITQDHPARLQPRHDQQPQYRARLSRECFIHGHLRR